MGKVVKTFKSKVSEDKIYNSFFKALNGVLKLTDKELQVASVFYKHKSILNRSIIDNDIANSVLFSSDYRKKLKDEVDLTSMGLNNYIAALKEKKIISNDNKLNPSFEFDVRNSISIVFDIDANELQKSEG